VFGHAMRRSCRKQPPVFAGRHSSDCAARRFRNAALLARVSAGGLLDDPGSPAACDQHQRRPDSGNSTRQRASVALACLSAG